MIYQLIRSSTRQIFARSVDLDRLEKLQEKYEARDILCEIEECNYGREQEER